MRKFNKAKGGFSENCRILLSLICRALTFLYFNGVGGIMEKLNLYQDIEQGGIRFSNDQVSMINPESLKSRDFLGVKWDLVITRLIYKKKLEIFSWG